MLACLVLTALALTGCGGGGNHGNPVVPKGNLKFTVIWPTESPSRVIPINAQSLLVSVQDASGATQTAIIARPASTTTFNELAVGAMTVTATAFANTTATGTPLATSTVSSTVTANNTSSVDVTLASTIDHLTVTPNPFTIGAGTSSAINVVAYDASGNVVLLDPSTLNFSGVGSIFSVNSSGMVTAGTTDGAGTITITQSDSGKTLSLPVSVVPTVTLNANSANLTLRGTSTFTATVVGPTNTSVNWSVLEGASGGSITTGGLYTAPATHGTYHVVATSAADSTRTATATVTVTSGSVGVTVH